MSCYFSKVFDVTPAKQKFTMPKTDLRCLMHVGVGNRVIAYMRSLHTDIPFAEMTWLKYSISF